MRRLAVTKGPWRTLAVLALAAIAALVLGSGVQIRTAPQTDAASSIETAYRATGSWAVSTGSATAYGGTYTLYYPTNLGANGFDHPILTWGNGTGATSSKYADTLGHLASWGFVVIASNSGQTGLGTEMLNGANHMVSENGNSSSIFYQKLDTTKIGALGHSQGAGGTLNATINSSGLIKTALTVALPDPFWWSTPLPNMANLTVPIFFVRGSSDFLATESKAVNWYNQVAHAAKASLKGTGHNEIQKVDTRLQGYITAWMMYTLQGDAVARGAFVGSPPELNTNTAWQHQAEKGLP